jgi:hypothetical protein
MKNPYRDGPPRTTTYVLIDGRAWPRRLARPLLLRVGDYRAAELGAKTRSACVWSRAFAWSSVRECHPKQTGQAYWFEAEAASWLAVV